MLREEKPEGVRRAPPMLRIGVDSEAGTVAVVRSRIFQ